MACLGCSVWVHHRSRWRHLYSTQEFLFIVALIPKRKHLSMPFILKHAIVTSGRPGHNVLMMINEQPYWHPFDLLVLRRLERIKVDSLRGMASTDYLRRFKAIAWLYTNVQHMVYSLQQVTVEALWKFSSSFTHSHFLDYTKTSKSSFSFWIFQGKKEEERLLIMKSTILDFLRLIFGLTKLYGSFLFHFFPIKMKILSLSPHPHADESRVKFLSPQSILELHTSTKSPSTSVV